VEINPYFGNFLVVELALLGVHLLAFLFCGDQRVELRCIVIAQFDKPLLHVSAQASLAATAWSWLSIMASSTSTRMPVCFSVSSFCSVISSA